MPGTGFLSDERCFWHAGGSFAFLTPVGGMVQPLVAGGLPEAPETKRRLKNLVAVSGLASELACTGAPSATRDDLLRVHPASYLDAFKALSDQGGGEIGLRAPFGPGGFEIAALSAGLVVEAVRRVAAGELRNAYALSRPPGHHCLPDWPNGFCLLNNCAVAVETAIAAGQAERVAIVDWDVHHGNGTEAVFWDRPDVLTISIHQERNYPLDTGEVEATGGEGAEGANVNIPLLPGAGHKAHLEVMDRIVLPKLRRFEPDLVVVACGFDGAGVDPLSRLLCSAETYRQMTLRLMDLTGGKLVCAHEGGYSEMYVPFCGHAVLEAMSGTEIRLDDPLGPRLAGQQPNARFDALQSEMIGEMAGFFGLS
ncbi:MAG: class II histone deacetylase [Rhodospirillales bacterium]